MVQASPTFDGSMGEDEQHRLGGGWGEYKGPRKYVGRGNCTDGGAKWKPRCHPTRAGPSRLPKNPERTHPPIGGGADQCLLYEPHIHKSGSQSQICDLSLRMQSLGRCSVPGSSLGLQHAPPGPHQMRWDKLRAGDALIEPHLREPRSKVSRVGLVWICPVRLSMKRRSTLLVPMERSSGRRSKMLPNRLVCHGWNLLMCACSSACTRSCKRSTSWCACSPLMSEKRTYK